MSDNRNKIPKSYSLTDDEDNDDKKKRNMWLYDNAQQFFVGDEEVLKSKDDISSTKSDHQKNIKEEKNNVRYRKI